MSKEPSSEQLTLYAEDSPVSPSHVQGSERGRMIIATCGLRCAESYGKLNPSGLWQKMYLDSLVKTEAWSSSMCSLTWRMQATKHSRLLFRLAVSVRRTGGIGCGLLRSPTAAESHNQDYSKQVYLQNQIAMLPTPNSSMGKTQDQGENRKTSGKQVEMATAVMDALGRNHGLKLQPAFVEYLMGYPIGYTEIMED